MYDYRRLKRIAEVEFPDIVVATEIIRQRKLRIIIIDSSYVDIFYSPDSTNRHFAYHWERVFLDGTFYRHDNIPDGNWKNVASFPKHFHNGQYENVQESNIPTLSGYGGSFALFLDNSNCCRRTKRQISFNKIY